MAASPKPKRPAPVQRMLDVLFEVETGTRDLIELVTEAMRAYHETGGLPERPTRFAWGRLPDPEPDKGKRARIIEDRAKMWEADSPAHARWSRRQDRIYFAVQDWRAALDTARELIPTVTRWTDRMDLPEIERWSAKLRGELSELGGVIHRIAIGDLPFLEEGTVRGLKVGLEQMESRSADLRNVGPEPVAPATAPVGSRTRPALDDFLHHMWICHNLLEEVIRNRPREEPPPTPEMVAEFRAQGGSLGDMGGSPREEAIERFREEVRPALAAWHERAILEARDRAGGAAGEIVRMLRRGMDAVDALTEAAARVRSTSDREWAAADAEHQEVTQELLALRPLVAVPVMAAPEPGPAPAADAAAGGAATREPAPGISAHLCKQLRRLQGRFEACYNGGKRLTLLVSRGWGVVVSREQWPPSWQKFHENAGSTGVGSYRCVFDDADTDSRGEFEALAEQALRLITAVPGYAGLGRLGHWIGAVGGFPSACWTLALAEAAADGACHPVVATRRVVARDPEKGWRQEIPWDPAERERELERHPHWRAAADALDLHPDAYIITPVRDAFLASAEAIALVLALLEQAAAVLDRESPGAGNQANSSATAAASDTTVPDHSDDPDFNRVVVDRSTFSVRWRGLTCPLGNIKPFDLIEILARRPGQYFNVQYLYDEVWGAEKKVKNALPQAISRLRRELESAGMEQLRIDGSEKDHYALIVP